MNAISGWERARLIFQAALDQPVGDRDAYVSTACRGDDELRREVVSLLAADDAAGGFLETPAFRIEDPRAAEPDPVLQPGDRIGHFEVLAMLGVGGMGEVYRAHDAQLRRDVAIKLLPPTFAADPQRLARFERESHILASLNHPNIASIHSVEQVDGLRVLVLELVEGPTLADLLQDGPLPVPEALGIARQLADALEAAHERGIVHRDLKPANVKIASSGRVMLLDFGLAKERAPYGAAHPASRDASGHTTDGLILGTCAYMSPEQARGKVVSLRSTSAGGRASGEAGAVYLSVQDRREGAVEGIECDGIESRPHTNGVTEVQMLVARDRHRPATPPASPFGSPIQHATGSAARRSGCGHGLHGRARLVPRRSSTCWAHAQRQRLHRSP